MKNKFYKVLTICMVLIMIVAFTACEDPEKESIEAINSTFTQLQTGKIDKISEALPGIESIADVFKSDSSKNSGLNSKQRKAFIGNLFSNMTFKVGKAKVSEDKSTVSVSVKVKNINMKKVVKNWYNDIYEIKFKNYKKADSQLTSKIMTAFSDNVTKIKKQKKYSTKTINVEVVKTENGWVINPTEKVIDAITGGFITAVSSSDTDQ